MDEPVGALVRPREGALELQPQVEDSSFHFDPDEVTKAARDFGLVRFSGQHLLASKTLGEAIKQMGAIRVGRSYLLSAADHTAEALAECTRIVSNTDDTRLQTQLLGFKSQLVRTLGDVGNSLIKSAEVDESNGASKPNSARAPRPGAQVPVVFQQQINVKPTGG